MLGMCASSDELLKHEFLHLMPDESVLLPILKPHMQEKPMEIVLRYLGSFELVDWLNKVDKCADKNDLEIILETGIVQNLHLFPELTKLKGEQKTSAAGSVVVETKHTMTTLVNHLSETLVIPTEQVHKLLTRQIEHLKHNPLSSTKTLSASLDSDIELVDNPAFMPPLPTSCERALSYIVDPLTLDKTSSQDGLEFE